MKDLINKKFGMWRVVKYSHFNPINHRHLWFCCCDCGIEKIIREDTLIGGLSKSCGCVNRHRRFNNRRWKGVGDISGTMWRKLQGGAKRRKISFCLAIEDLWTLYLRQNKKCALTGLDITFSKKVNDYDGNASLDRIDSNKGYTIDNVQWVDKRVNNIKQDLPETEFIELCKLVVEKCNK